MQRDMRSVKPEEKVQMKLIKMKSENKKPYFHQQHHVPC